jgi:GAF domain-containing protein
VDDPEFIARLARVERALAMDRGIVGKLEAVAGLATRMIERCDAAGLALEARGRTHSIGTTDDVVLEVDLVQYDTGEGPCLESIKESKIVRFDVLEPDERWEHFAPGALAHHIQSVLSLPIVARGSTVGALNLYSETVGGVEPESEPIALALAAYAGEVISTSPLYAYSLELLDEVVDELAAHELIHSAVGIVMSRTGKAADDALATLAEVAAHQGQSIREAAEWELREQQFRDDVHD